MGYMRHHAIAVTGWKREHVESARENLLARLQTAQEPMDGDYEHLVSPIISGVINEQYTFFLAPDGSKEWWSTSDAIEKVRHEFIDWLRGSHLYLDWVEVQFGDDERETKITAHSDEDEPEDDEGREGLNE